MSSSLPLRKAAGAVSTSLGDSCVQCLPSDLLNLNCEEMAKFNDLSIGSVNFIDTFYQDFQESAPESLDVLLKDLQELSRSELNQFKVVEDSAHMNNINGNEGSTCATGSIRFSDGVVFPTRNKVEICLPCQGCVVSKEGQLHGPAIKDILCEEMHSCLHCPLHPSGIPEERGGFESMEEEISQTVDKIVQDLNSSAESLVLPNSSGSLSQLLFSKVPDTGEEIFPKLLVCNDKSREEVSSAECISYVHEPFKCGSCFMKFARFENLTHHIKSHTGAKAFCCNSCGITFELDKDLSHFFLLHKHLSQIECNFCNMKLASHSEYEEHIACHISPTSQNGKDSNRLDNKCDSSNTCIKIDVKDCAELKDKISPRKNFKCKICGKCYVKAFKLKSHVGAAHRAHSLECGHCRRRFSKSSVYSRHVASHGNKPTRKSSLKAKIKIKIVSLRSKKQLSALQTQSHTLCACTTEK